MGCAEFQARVQRVGSVRAWPGCKLLCELALAFCLVAASGCVEPVPFTCSGDQQCALDDGQRGRCEANSFCSYEADTCDAARRWGPYAETSIAGACLALETRPAEFAGCAGRSTGPAACEGFAGGGRLDVDMLDGDTQEPLSGYLIFDFADLVDRTIIGATLELTVPDSDTADSDASGRVVIVAPFSAADLEAGIQPVRQPNPLALGVGAVALGQAVQWSLEPADLPADGALFLAIDPESDDNAQYWSGGGANSDRAPRLLFELAK